MSTKMLSVKEVIERTGLTPVYIRKAISSGKLVPDKKVSFNKNPNQFKYLFSEETIANWRKSCETRTRRTDGRRKYNFYATQAEMDQFLAWKNKNEIGVEIKVANPAKES